MNNRSLRLRGRATVGAKAWEQPFVLSLSKHNRGQTPTLNTRV
jgi:hypothetical protein